MTEEESLYDEIKEAAREGAEKAQKSVDFPSEYDVRMSAIANTAGIDVTGGMIGYLAIVT